jgi:hypothetical protein
MSTLQFMSKQAKPEKASVPPEGTRSVAGKTIAPNATVIEVGSPAATSQIVTVQEYGFSLALPQTISKDDYATLGKRMGAALQGASWKVGDYANFGKATFGFREYDVIAEYTGLDQVYLRTCASVAERVPAEFRELASLERFRLMLPHRAKLVKEGKATSELEPIPELVGRFNGWTQAEIRAGKKAEIKQLSAADTGTAGRNETADDAGGGDGAGKSTGSDDGAGTTGGTGTKAEKVVTASEIHRMLGEVHDAVQAMSADRLAIFSAIEQKVPRLPQTLALLRILRDQVRTELNKGEIASVKVAE